MSKFLQIIEEAIPKVDIDAITEAKRSLQRMLMKLNVSVQAKVFQDILLVTLPDMRVVELEVKGISSPKEEEAEDSAAEIKAITAIASIPDQGFGKQLVSKTARQLATAKRNMATAAEKISQKFLDAV